MEAGRFGNWKQIVILNVEVCTIVFNDLKVETGLSDQIFV